MPESARKTTTHAELASQVKGPKGEVFIQRALPIALEQVGLKAISVAFVGVENDRLIFSASRGTGDKEIDKVADVLNGLLKQQQPTRTIYHALLYSKIHKFKGNLEIAQNELASMLETSQYGKFLGITLDSAGPPHGQPKVHYNAPAGMAACELIKISDALCKRLERRLFKPRQQMATA